MSIKSRVARRALLASVASSTVALGVPAGAIVISNPTTPTQIIDPVNITGIGQMIVNQGGGSVGLCTGTLINPRMVLFAAHCVNTRAATAYGSNQGGTPIGFGFRADNLPGTRSFILAGPNQFKTNEALAFYNASQVFYHPASLEPAARGFLYGDVAIAALDTPASKIPTWTMLFSPLASPASISPATGTGYHVTIAGYGSTGTGTTGSTGSDFRRRVAENMLGILGSLDDTNSFLFGGPPRGLPQVLYQIDFDDPLRGRPGANPRDFNFFRDNALPREGSTAPGDSGGPLIIDRAFAKPTVIGVLSGGSRFFANQPADSYGTTSFYQPLFLYWDYIVANNPYRYVSATAGDGNWNDPTRWVTNLDPAYQVLGANGQLVNGVPTDLGAGKNGNSPKFGELCFQSGATNECRNLATGQTRNNVANSSDQADLPLDEIKTALPTVSSHGGTAGTGELSDSGTVRSPVGTARVAELADDDAVGSHIGTARISDLIDQVSGIGFADLNGEPGETAQASEPGKSTADVKAAALPLPTLANGLPGATNFVPNNTDGVRATAVPARYFDVTLSAAGTTTLDTRVTIDRFTITGMQAGLNIASAGSLTSLIDVTQFAGRNNVDGTLRTNGDYALIGGLLTGRGTVVTPFLTSVLGSIAPGTVGTIGTLNVQGNVILSSGSQLSIDFGPNGASDRLAVTANGTSTGRIDLGGRVGFNPVGRPTFGSQFTFITATGGVFGAFNAITDLPGVLFPVITYGPNSVSARIEAASFFTVINRASSAQASLANLLDRNRANYADLSALFGELDVLDDAAVQAAFESLAPRTEATKISMARMSTDSMTRFYRERMGWLSTGEAGGTLAMMGNPVQFAALQSSGAGEAMMSDAGQDGMMTSSSVVLPDEVSAFVAAGYLDGSARPLPSLIGQRDDLDGWYAAAGVEVEAAEGSTVGLGFHYADTEGTSALGQQAKGNLYQGTLYGIQQLGGGLVAHAQLSAGLFQTDTRRLVTAGASNFRLTAENNSLAVSGEGGIGKRMALGRFTLTPNAALRFSILDFGSSRERGGVAALVVRGGKHESVQGRLGADFEGNMDRGGMTITPRLTAAFVHEFQDQPDFVDAGFAATAFSAGTVPFLLPSSDHNWGEVGAGVKIGGDRFSVSLSAEATLRREDVRYQTYRVGANIKF